MILRLALAYGAVQAVIASAAVVSAAVVLGQQAVGVTRQPLPLIWPLGVLLVMAAQLPLREILGPTERTADRRMLSRALRAGFSLLVVAAGSVTTAFTHPSPVLVFVLLLTAVAFAATSLTQADPWVCSLGLGMSWVGLQFVTPLGTGMAEMLEVVGVAAATAIAMAGAVLYVVTQSPLSALRNQAHGR